MGARIDGLLNAALVVAAMGAAGALVHREFAGTRSEAIPPENATMYSGWESLLAAGHRTGDSLAPVQIIAFMDLQCPFCRVFDRSLRSVQLLHAPRVSSTFIHLPLPNHLHARRAAQAAECALRDGRFEPMVETIFAYQDSLARLPTTDARFWRDLAEQAGVGDLDAYAACMTSEQPPPRIMAGLEVATSLGITATPTVIINGIRLRAPPGDSVLNAMVRALAEGRSTRDVMEDLRRLPR